MFDCATSAPSGLLRFAGEVPLTLSFVPSILGASFCTFGVCLTPHQPGLRRRDSPLDVLRCLPSNFMREAVFDCGFLGHAPFWMREIFT